jgi:hypothetical protein
LSLGESRSAPIDLSKATKLKYVFFWPISPGIEWVVRALQTITPEHRKLRQVTIRVSGNSRQAIDQVNSHQWLDLDRLLVQFWDSGTVRVKLVTKAGWGSGYHLARLLPEIMGKKTLDLVEYV